MRNFIYLIAIALLVPVMGYSQSFRVSGTVTDAKDGSGLAGVTVKSGGNTVSQTDGDGKYSIMTSSGETLTFSFLGMKSTSVVVGSQTIVNIAMEEDLRGLDEVVVVGYGVIKKSDLTGAVSSLKSEQLTRLSTVDVNQSLQGRAAGVSVINNSGEPGAGTKIRIRGIGSVNNSSPLYVVDGFPVNDISHLAPQDVESMEILKDASAVAIYGSRGANGVILVKTKGGAYGKKTQVSVNTFAGITQPGKKMEMLNAAEFARLKLESYKNANLVPSNIMQSILDYAINNNSVGTNWQDEIMRTGATQSYNLNVSGGTEKSRFDIGGTYSQEKGIIKNTYLDKFTFHINNEYSLFKNVTAGINAFYTTYEKSGNDGDFYSGSITQALKADPVSAAFDSYTNEFGEIYFSYGRNPAQSVYENQFRKGGEDRFTAQGYLQIKDILIKGLSFRSQYGRQFTFSKSKNYYPKYYITANQQRDRSSLSENRNTSYFWNFTNYLTYLNDFGRHSINATLGTEAQKSNSSNISALVYDVPMDADLRYLGMSSNKINLQASGGAGHNSLLSGFFRLNYAFAGKYLFTGTFRADGTSKFKKKWGYFPSFSLGWNVADEAFMSGISKSLNLSDLKLRVGWGHVGNQASAGDFDYLALMTNGYTAVFGGNQVDGALQQKLANESLFWETSEQINAGIDFGLFRGALSGNIDYFIRNTNDMILDTPIPIYAGMWRSRTNAGSVRNSGVELALNYNKKINNDLSLGLGVNLAAIRNKVTSLGGGEPLFGQYSKTQEGGEIAAFFGLQTAGIFKTQAQLESHSFNGKPIQPNAGLGDVIFVDQNGDGVIDDNDRVFLGSPNPKLTYGFNLSAQYKNFDFLGFFQGTQGNKIANYMYSVMYSTSMREWSNSRDMLNSWSPERSDSDLPRVHSGDPNRNDRFSDLYLQDGSYLRLRTLQLGYSLPTKVIGKVKASGARIYVSADNILTWTRYTGFNPEMGDLYGSPLNAGVDMASYPTPRVFTIGCNLTF